MNPIAIVLIVASLLAGYGGSQFQAKRKATKAASLADKKQAEAQAAADKVLTEARREAKDILAQARQEEEERRAESKEATKRLNERELALDKKLDDLDKRAEKLRKNEAEVDELKDMVQEIKARQEEKLEKIASTSKKEAAEKLMALAKKEIQADLKGLLAKMQKDAQQEAEEQSRAILLATMERLSSEVTAERTVTVVKIDNDDIKGRIIGREGRNIQAFQTATGVDILVDDSPQTILLSCFDPVRREVARQALEMLIKDGRIHPGRIEELVEKARRQVQKEIIKVAEDAIREVGVVGVPPEVLQLLGELRYRTSYGQNVLKHSTEMAHLAGVLADQLGADRTICKYAALVHDLGKALTHKMEGKHHHISGQMLRKYGVAEEVAHAAEAHHDDLEATTPEAMVVRVVDAISAARPGARNISAEDFLERMKDLENIATGFDGVERAYAISAGREVRVFVHPENLDDLRSIQVARDIAVKIESTMSYPGTVKVTVIRETRAIEYAK